MSSNKNVHSQRVSSASLAISDLSLSVGGGLNYSSRGKNVNGNEVPESSKNPQKVAGDGLSESKKLLQPSATDDHGNKSSSTTKGSDNESGWCLKALTELQCVQGSNSDSQELDPFSKRRIAFIVLIVVIAIVVNLVVIPIALTNMEKSSGKSMEQVDNGTAGNGSATVLPSAVPSAGSSVLFPSALTETETVSASPSVAAPSAAPSNDNTIETGTTVTRSPSEWPSITPTTSPVVATDQPSMPPSQEPSVAPVTPNPTDLHSTLSPTQPSPTAALIIPLPPETLDAIESPGTPQAKAFQWLGQDPNTPSYSTSRKLQRFSLACFFYATNEQALDDNLNEREPTLNQQSQQRQGARRIADQSILDDGNNNDAIDPEVSTKLFTGDDDVPLRASSIWHNSTSWLSYTVHECDWYSQALSVCDTTTRSYRYLALQANGLRGRLPPELGLLTSLQQIILTDNVHLYGSLPVQLGRLTQLSSLQLSNLPQLSGAIPPSLANLHASLQQIHLRETPFFHKIIASELGLLTNLQELLLDTQINTASGATSKSGTLPTEIGSMVALRQFAITGQELVGTLPEELALPTNLEWLMVSNTLVGGSIPPQLGRLSHLAKLQLTFNRLTSNLPAELGLLRKSLTSLELKNNELTGTIPFQFSNLTRCSLMEFQFNLLTGSVPMGLCYLQTTGVVEVLRVDCKPRDQKKRSTTFAFSSGVSCSCDCECF